MITQETVVYGRNVYIAAPEGTVPRKAVADLALFVDNQLTQILVGKSRLSEIMNPVGITLVGDNHFPEDRMTMKFSVDEDRVYLNIHPNKFLEMQQFMNMSPSVWQLAVAAAGTIGLSHRTEQESGSPLTFDEKCQTARQIVNDLGNYLREVAERTNVKGSFLKGEDVVFG